jgi:hypothetical protein
MEGMRKVISGGQTGVDRAALDVALRLGLACGGFCPRGRRAEDGPIDERYPLVETPSDDYAERTEWNVRHSDGTLVLARGSLSGGTALTIELARRLGRPCHVVDLARDPDPVRAARWLAEARIHVLNVAGPRESQRPGIGAEARTFLERLLTGATSARA